MFIVVQYFTIILLSTYTYNIGQLIFVFFIFIYIYLSSLYQSSAPDYHSQSLLCVSFVLKPEQQQQHMPHSNGPAGPETGNKLNSVSMKTDQPMESYFKKIADGR